jgi:glycosyltransferase involved in cell wall biosynthesis
MPSRLVPYPNSCQHPEQKLARAIDSVINQSFADFELIVVADGCLRTKDIFNNYKDKRIKLIEIKHGALFDNRPRNTGIDNASGEYILYCDADDYLGSEHLNIINKQLKNQEWVYYNDLWLSRGKWEERYCNIHRLGKCGTSNICHLTKLRIKWQRTGYAHDFHFIQQLIRHKEFRRINTPEYFVCHIPGAYDL